MLLNAQPTAINPVFDGKRHKTVTIPHLKAHNILWAPSMVENVEGVVRTNHAPSLTQPGLKNWRAPNIQG